MATVPAPVRRRFLAGAFVAAIALALLAPVAAYAATTASFTSRAPASGAHMTTGRPGISVTVYDRYGAHGSGAISMTMDRRSMVVSTTYIVSGSWNPSHPNYTRFRLTGRMTSDLAPGTHTISVRVHDLKHKTSTLTWSFVVQGPPPAYKASFSAPVPANGSSGTTTRPTLSLTAYDKYGVTGAGTCTMLLDGSPVTPAVGYTASRVYTGFKITYPVPSVLRTGTHTVVVGVTNVKGNASSYSWSFTVVEPPLVAMPVSGTSCTDCHIDIVTAHPMTNCVACHSPTAPRRADGTAMHSYALTDVSAHTTVCATSLCHRGGGAFPHVIGSDCTRCHTGTYPGIPASHTLATETLHQSTSQFCIRSGCHVASLTLEHYRRTINGVKLSCATCHGSADPAVRAAINAKSTACESCHDFGKISHPGTTTGHVASGSCIGSSCHATNVADVHHGKCDACHAANKTASTVCADCHSATSIHTGVSVKHTPAASGCISTTCHGKDVAVIHKNDCTRCHNTTVTASTVCATCHTGATAPRHVTIGTRHTAPIGTCVKVGCHLTDVTAIHLASYVDGRPGPGCVACHADGQTASVVCESCHTGDLGIVHKNAVAAHTAPISTESTGCVKAPGCHLTNPTANVTDVTAIHSAGINAPGCAACHAPDKTPSLICVTCHSGGINALHAKAGASHTAPIVSCVSVTCHEPDITAIHGRTGGPGCAACHAPNKTPSAACAFCHSADVTTLHAKADPKHVLPADLCVTVCHTTSVSVIHDKGVGCVACHDGFKTPSTTCADCHTRSIANIHASAAGFHIASSASCVNTGCHVPDVTVIHGKMAGNGCSACHGPKKTPSILCGDCHPGDVTAQHSSADASHTAPAGTSCIGSSCHDRNVATAHVNGPGCSACHEEGATASTTCAKCHTKTMSELHARGSASHTGWSPTCITPTCHASGNVAAIHDTPNHDGSAGPSCAACHRNPDHAASIVCADCHTGASAPQHVWAASLHVSPASECVTDGCHPTDVIAIHTTTHKDGTTGPSCAACHADGKTPSVVCSTCHGSDLAIVHAPGDRPHAAPAGYCIQGGCHVPNVVKLHSAGTNAPGCVCHRPDKTLTVACAACHSTDTLVVHARGAVPHANTTGLCVTSGCHSHYVVTVHNRECYRCHVDGEPASVVCTDCHVKTPAELHATVAGLETSHTAQAGVCVNIFCHGPNVAVLHDPSTQQCAACHNDKAPPTLVCVTCHTEDPFVKHKNAAAMHIVASTDDTGCVKVGCHAADVVALHSAGTHPPGCSACHDPTKVPSLICSTCHESDTAVVHVRGDASHNPANATCIKTGCHVGNVVTLHSAGANAPGCAACHANPDHTLTADCFVCHGSDSRTVHNKYITTQHDAPVIVCNQIACHFGSVAGIHAAPYPDGTAGPSCAACHSNPDHAATTDCNVCHVPTTVPARHASQESTHTAPVGTCTPGDAGCHNANVTTIHAADYPNGDPGPGCTACHANPKHGPSLVCADCHAGGFTIAHPAPAAAHTVTETIDTECVKSGCHGSAVVAIHFADWPGHDIPGCSACHGYSKHGPSLVCADCHFATFADHVVPVIPHTAAANDCTVCHTDQVATIHVLGGVSKCQACHANPEHKPTTDCTVCHTTGAFHSKAAASHDVSASGCTSTTIGCHPVDVSVTHTPTTKSCQNCHVANGPTPTTDCSTCHAQHHANAPAKHAVANACTTANCHASDISVIHVKSLVQHCEACHTPGRTPSTTCTAASPCHGASAGDHTASHDAACNNCHSYNTGSHSSPPTIGTGNCLSCHGTPGAIWHHPTLGCNCHGLGTPGPWTMPW